MSLQVFTLSGAVQPSSQYSSRSLSHLVGFKMSGTGDGVVLGVLNFKYSANGFIYPDRIGEDY